MIEYTQEEIREAHKRVKADIENAIKTQKGIALALECQNIVLNHLTGIMTEEEITEDDMKESKPEEEEEEAQK